MITLQTITTIELSSICNLSCLYCINRLLVIDPERRAGIMTDAVFERSIDLLNVLCSKGTQQEVNLNGNGESFLDPKLPQRIKRVREIMGNRVVQLCTNGVNVTEESLRAVQAAGISGLDISGHSPYHVRRLIPILKKLNIKGVVNMGAAFQSHNWAGQLEPEHSIEELPVLECHPLIEGRGYVQSEGTITPCCYDYRNFGSFGTVFDSDILEHPIRPYSLCATCHQQIPQEIIAANNWED